MENTLIVDWESFDRKVELIRKAGPDKLHIVADFDRTLTAVSEDGKAPTTSWASFTEMLGEEYADERKKLFDQYRPIEIDESLDLASRSAAMKEWWHKHLDLLIRHGVSNQDVQKLASETSLSPRKGLAELIEFTKANNIPFLIFSAGIGDLISLYLSRHAEVPQNIHIVSNFFTHDSGGKITGFKDEIIHSLNKNEGSVRTEAYAKAVAERPNCILLGDTLEDVHMTDGMSHDTVLKIGFLNGNTAALEAFKQKYDVVLLDENASIDLNKLIAF